MKIILIMTLFCTPVFAAISRDLQVEGILRQPLEDRIEALSKQGDKGRLSLQHLAFDSQQKLETRWRALTALGRVYPRESKSTLGRALRSPEWFMRNAALIVLPYNDRTWAIKWSRILMHDPALVVRTAAVNTLRQLSAVETTPLLWEKLYSSENYRAGQSLWIRRHILETLVQFASRGQEAEFMTVLGDKDASLHPLAIQALEKITQKKFTEKTQWQSWWSDRNKKSI